MYRKRANIVSCTYSLFVVSGILGMCFVSSSAVDQKLLIAIMVAIPVIILTILVYGAYFLRTLHETVSFGSNIESDAL